MYFHCGRCFSFITACFLFLSGYINLNAEYVFIKNGEIKQGSIISENAASITIRSGKDKKSETINRSDIMRLLYTELYMGKVYVQKTDGKNEICYMVDEDRISYTFRKELYSPVEFQLKRDEVLFMARGNPSGLKGEPSTDSADLTWFPPYNPVKKYRLYIKGPGEKQFTPSAECGGTNYTLKKLKSNTKYIMYVAALDEAGDESLPSNELTITTLNIKPDRPVNLKYEKRDSIITETKKGKKITSDVTKRFVAWDAVSDIDGVIKGYNIYYNKDGKDEKIATVPGAEYEIPEDKSVYDLRITAVDDRNDESPASRIRHPRAIKIGVQPLYFIPQGKLADMFDPGYGVFAAVSLKNFYIQNLECGISAGAVKLPGKKNDKIDRMIMVPVTADGGYHFAITEWFSVMPYAGAGYTYMDINYTSLFEDENKKVWEPVVRAGAVLCFESDYFHISAGGDYGAIYETSEMKTFFEVYVRTGVLLDL